MANQDGSIRIAKKLKDRENPNKIGLTIGEVISPYPEIIIKTDKYIFEKDKLVVSSHIGEHYKNIDDTWLVPGDKVILIPFEGEKIWYVCDKVVIP